GAPPAVVVGNTEYRAKSPGRAGRRHLESGDLADPFPQLGVVGCSQPDVVWKDHCPRGLAIAMDGIDTRQDTRTITRTPAGCDVAIDQAGPVAGAARTWDRGARREDRARHLAGDVGGRHVLVLTHDHLGGLLLQGHLAEERADLVNTGLTWPSHRGQVI